MWLLVSLALWMAEPQRVVWEVEGTPREGLVFWPTKPSGADGAPVVLAFHGHGGNSRRFAANFPIHAHWPEAVVVYPQGLPTPGRTDPEGKLPGWQRTPGYAQDRDVKLVDAILAWLPTQRPIDNRRLYATGHSNGGAFTYLLWAVRAEKFAAFAPSSSPGLAVTREMTPRPALHLAGEHDQVVPLAAQQRTLAMIRQLNGCQEEGEAWGRYGRLYRSARGNHVVAVIHPGGHALPAEAAGQVVRFFRDEVEPGRRSQPLPGARP